MCLVTGLNHAVQYRPCVSLIQETREPCFSPCIDGVIKDRSALQPHITEITELTHWPRYLNFCNFSLISPNTSIPMICSYTMNCIHKTIYVLHEQLNITLDQSSNLYNMIYHKNTRYSIFHILLRNQCNSWGTHFSCNSAGQLNHGLKCEQIHKSRNVCMYIF